MSPRIEIVPCTLAHLRALSANLREGDAAEVEASGTPCRHLLFSLWRNSTYRKAAFVDGEIGGAWGCAGSMLSSVGEPWLLTGKAAEHVKVSFMKIARREMAQMLCGRQTLVSGVAVDYKQAIKFVAAIGFRVSREYTIPVTNARFCEIRMGD